METSFRPARLGGDLYVPGGGGPTLSLIGTIAPFSIPDVAGFAAEIQDPDLCLPGGIPGKRQRKKQGGAASNSDSQPHTARPATIGPPDELR